MSEISKLTELRKLMLAMERSLGLEELSPTERDIFYAASELARETGNVKTTWLMKHALVSNISRPTFFRALKSLVQKGYLSSCRSAGRGLYVVHSRDN